MLTDFALQGETARLRGCQRPGRIPAVALMRPGNRRRAKETVIKGE